MESQTITSHTQVSNFKAAWICSACSSNKRERVKESTRGSLLLQIYELLIPGARIDTFTELILLHMQTVGSNQISNPLDIFSCRGYPLLQPHISDASSDGCYIGVGPGRCRWRTWAGRERRREEEEDTSCKRDGEYKYRHAHENSFLHRRRRWRGGGEKRHCCPKREISLV